MSKLSSSLPQGEGNGLAALGPRLTEEPHKPRVALIVLNCKSISTDVDTGEITPTARILRIEPVLEADLARAEQLMRRGLQQRTGQETLPIDLEDEIGEIFSQLRTDEDPDQS